MRQYNKKWVIIVCSLSFCLFGSSSCVDDLLDQTPKGELASSLYWKTEQDAEYAINGVYAQARAMFNRDYTFDGNTEYLRFRGNVSTSQATGDRSIAYRNGSYSFNDFSDCLDYICFGMGFWNWYANWRFDIKDIEIKMK